MWGRTALDSTVGDPKLPIKILTFTYFITDPAMHGLWLQWDPYFKVIGYQKQLLENISFQSEARSLRKD